MLEYQPAKPAETGKNNHRNGNDQDSSQCPRLRPAGVTRHLRHEDGLLADRTIDLRSRIAGVALDLLAALRAGELEFNHKFYWPRNVAGSDMTWDLVRF